MLLFCDVSRQIKLWEENWQTLSEDILHIKRKLFKYPELQLTDEQIRNYYLLEIQELLHRYGMSLTNFKDLPQPNPNLLINMDHRLIREALDFDIKRARNIFLAPPGRHNVKRYIGHDHVAGRNIFLAPPGRHILPVIPKAKRSEIVQSYINISELWKYCKVFTLTRSMGVNEYSANEEIDIPKQEFNQWVLGVGYGNLPAKIKEGKEDPTWIDIPEKFLIKSWDSPI
ncbi:ATP-dependent DNA helicase PIF2 [Tanacetum coccineum]